jgi:hypothetical protein
VRALVLFAAVFSFFGAACHPGGEYAGAGNSIVSGDVDKGETNGRMFDFVSDKPEGDDWQIRVRGTSIWVSYTDKNGKTDNRGTKALTQAESDKLWKLVDEVDIPSRKGGKKDDDNGTVTLRLREPGDDEGDMHKIFTVYVSRDTEDDDVIAVGTYLRKLVDKHYQETPNF